MSLNREILRKLANIGGNVQKPLFERIYSSGTDITEMEWDNLIILDACRHDYFEQVNEIEGDYSTIFSRGAHSWEFMEKNFIDQDFHDTVYVTSNAYGLKYSVKRCYIHRSSVS